MYFFTVSLSGSNVTSFSLYTQLYSIKLELSSHILANLLFIAAG